jgi:tetratricopeptide (TPR) repeat protein
VFEKVGDSREVAVTQVGMADLLVVRENYKEAQKLYETCLETCQKLQDWHSVGAILVRLGQLFLTTNRQEEAQSALLNAKKIFQEMRATNWLAAIDELLAQLQDSFSGAAARTETGIALAELVQMVQAGRAGDRQKGEEAFNFLTEMALSGDAETAVLARALRLVLLGDAPQKAVAGLPEAVRRKVLALLG